MSPTSTGTLRLPGTNLYYEVRGAGPMLLILQGGDGDAGGSDGLARHLVDYCTVVTIVPAAGLSSRETWTHHCARVLAEQLGTEFVEFPRGHNGYVLRPRAFAAKLRKVDLLRSTH